MGKRRPVFRDESECDGHGTLTCHCGGDLCVCGRDGEDCFGCEKCQGRDDYDDFTGEDEARTSGVARQGGKP